MIEIPAGAFRMGSDAGPDDERPAHEVRLAAYAIDRLPVTNAEFAAFLNAAGPRNARGERLYDDDDDDARIHRANEFKPGRWRADSGFEAHPAVEVSFRGAAEYCAWAGKRLPTEAEWEKAARGADGRRYPWGNQAPDATRARYGAAFNATAPAGSHPAGASAHGVLDMAGNVWQWTSSLYRAYPWRADDGREDARSPEARVTRGGAHDWPAGALTATHRGRGLSRAPAAGHHNIGFRCAR
jgi:iron(II)-dependent oxidoreductase